MRRALLGVFLLTLPCPLLLTGGQDSDTAQGLAQQGIDLYRQGRFSEAKTALAKALEREPKHLRARLYWARTLFATDQSSGAVRELGRVLELHSGEPEAQYEVGRILQELAGSRFSKLSRLAPDSAETHELLGQHHEAMGRLSEALAEYRLAQQRDRKRAGIHFLAGNILWKLQDHDAALRELLAELRLNPNHSKAHHRAGSIYVLRNQVAEAIPHLEKTVLADPESLEARRDLGRALRLAGKPEDALGQLQFVAERRPQDDRVHAQLAAAYRDLGDRERAAAEMKIHQGILANRFRAARDSFDQRSKSGVAADDN